MRRLMTLSVVATLLTAVARADAPVPGAKPVRHDQFVDNVGDFPDYVFYVSGYRQGLPPGFQGANASAWDRLGDNGLVQRTRWSSIHRVAYLYAIPRALAQEKGADQEAWFAGKVEGVLKADVPFAGSFVPDTSRASRVQTHYLAILESGTLKLELVSRQELDAFGLPAEGSRNWWVVGGALLASLGLALAGLVRCRAARARAGPRR